MAQEKPTYEQTYELDRRATKIYRYRRQASEPLGTGDEYNIQDGADEPANDLYPEAPPTPVRRKRRRLLNTQGEIAVTSTARNPGRVGPPGDREATPSARHEGKGKERASSPLFTDEEDDVMSVQK